MNIRSLKAFFSRLLLKVGRGAPQLQRARAVIGQSDLFDPEWYIRRYPDVARAKLNPLDHFIMHGSAEGRSPGPRFDAKWYLQRNADVARSDTNPLVHYLVHGRHEGRSIRPVQPGSDESEDADYGGKAGGAKQKASAQPYADEYDAGWLAAPMEWMPLWARHAESPPPPSYCGDHETDLASLCRGLGEGCDRARIGLFLATAPGGTPTGDRDWRDVGLTGLGIEAIADGWFAHARLLMLRMTDADAVPGTVIGFQYDALGQPVCIGAQPVAGATALIRLELCNPLTPVLLVWLSADRAIHATTLIAFPSLYRGGAHHAELLAAQELEHQPQVAARYMAELASAFYAQGDLLLGKITVQLRGANGSESIFQPAFADVLSRHFGVVLSADDSATGSGLVADRLTAVAVAPALAERRRGGAELLLPCDCLPSLAALCSARDSERLGSETFCVVPDFGRAPPVLACLPRPTAQMIRLQHPALPFAQPTWKPGASGLLPGQEYGLPTAIRTMNPKVWAVDTLVPLPPDVPDLSRTGAQDRLPTIGVILHDNGSQVDLDICLQAIAAQRGVTLTRVGVLSARAELTLPENGVQTVPIRFDALDPAGVTSEMASNEDSVVLFVDSNVFPHDPRTFAILAALCIDDDTGVVTCPVVTSSPEEGADERAMLPRLDDVDASSGTGHGEQIVSLFPAYNFAIAAMNPQILAVRGEYWRAFLASTQFPETPAGIALALANCCSESGQRTVATTLVRVASHSQPPSFADNEPAPASEVQSGNARPSAAQIVRLMP